MPRESKRATPPPNGVAGHDDGPAGLADDAGLNASASVEPESAPALAEVALAAFDAPTQLVPTRPEPRPRVLEGSPDPGLYALLGLTPDVSDAEILTSYRRQAARLSSDPRSDRRTLRQLNVAYEVLGNPVRRAEYDRALRASLHTAYAVDPPTHQPGIKGVDPHQRRRRPRQMVQTRAAGFPEVLVLVGVVALSLVVGWLIIERVAVNLSGLNVLSSVLSLTTGPRRLTIEGPVTPSSPTPSALGTLAPAAAAPAAVAATVAPTSPPAAPTAPAPAPADRFAGSTVAMSTPNPPQNTAESILVRLRRDGQPAANVEVYADVQYKTTLERWPRQGTVRTNADGAATITFNVGPAIPGFTVQVQVHTQVDGQPVSWATSFTPR